MNGPRPIRFVADDPMGLWKEGDHGYELGQEHPGVRVWVIRHSRSGQLLTLESPYERGLIRLDDE